jgi:hypothetical protein
MPPEQAEDLTAVQEAPTLRASLEAAFAADTGDAPAAAAPVPAAASGAPAAPVAPAAAAAGDRPRDETGRFAPKPAEGAAPTAAATPPTGQSAAPGTEAPQEPIRPPAAWSAPAKAKFATLDPELQAEIAKRERDVDKGMAERAAHLKRYEPLEQVIAPHRNYLAMNGLDDATYVKSLIAADEQLRGPNPAQALAFIARTYGIDLRGFGQPGQQQPAQQAQQVHPQIQALNQQVAQLTQTLTQQQTAQQQAAATQTQSEIDAFAKDNMYFENVRSEIAALLRAGVVDNLPDAYRKACWSRDDIRPLLIEKETADRAAATTAAASAKARDARQAGGSITGSPAAGSVPVRTGPPPSIRESLEAQFGGLS